MPFINASYNNNINEDDYNSDDHASNDHSSYDYTTMTRTTAITSTTTTLMTTAPTATKTATAPTTATPTTEQFRRHRKKQQFPISPNDHGRRKNENAKHDDTKITNYESIWQRWKATLV